MLLLIPLVISVAVFLPSLQNGFVDLDDPFYVLANPVIKAFTSDNVRTVLTEPFLATYLPITMLSYMIEYHLFGLEPFGYHLTNLAFHLLCTLLVFLITERIVGSVLVAFITSTLFGVHTLHVESVAWIAARKDVLYGFGFLWALYLYLSHLRTGRSFSAYYWASLLVFVLSALSKAQAIVLPIVLVLVDVVLKRDFSIKRLVLKIPFFIPAILLGLLAVVAQTRGGAVSEFNTAPPVYRVFLGCYALMIYLWKLALPINLSCFYPYPITDGHIDTRWVGGSPLILLAVGWATYRLARNSREILFGVLFFAITIAPFLQFVPIGSALYADRYTYIASIGIFLVVGLLVTRYVDVGGPQKYVVYAAGVIYLAFLAGNTFNRTHVWKDTVTLATDGIVKEPAAGLLYGIRAMAYQRQGDTRNALDDWNNAVRYGPSVVANYVGRGNLLLRDMKQFALAADDYSRAIQLLPGFADAYYARAEAYGQLGRTAEALADVDKAIAMKPDFANAYVVRGILHLRVEQPDAALRDLNRAIELEPGVGNAYFNRALTYAAKRDFPAAYADAVKAKELGFTVDQDYLDELRARSGPTR